MRTGYVKVQNSNRYYRAGGHGDYYVDGNTARKLDVREEIHKAPKKKPSVETQKKQAQVKSMSLGYVLFLGVALAVASVVMINYLSVRSENTAILKTISTKESQLNSMKLANDEEYSRIISAVDLEYVKDVALNDLNMQYAEEGQIVVVSAQGDDYVRQYQQMP